jgi:hypothetical protein
MMSEAYVTGIRKQEIYTQFLFGNVIKRKYWGNLVTNLDDKKNENMLV